MCGVFIVALVVAFSACFIDAFKILQIDTVKKAKAFHMNTGSTIDTKPSIGVRIADRALTTVFKIKPLFKLASKKARDMMIQRGGLIGADWEGKKAYYESKLDILQITRDKLLDKSLIYPDYYLQPFHAYDEGNLSWQAAMEVESAALTVHAQIYTKEPKELDSLGDFRLRDNFHHNMRNMLNEGRPTFRPKDIVDIGCSTGLSTWKFLESFPEANIIGLDLSPYMLSVARFDQETNERLPSTAKSQVSFIHSAGENLTNVLGKDKADLVSLSLVSHELPEQASRTIFQAAYDTLRSGGAFALMDMDPLSGAFQRVAQNPFAFAAFKSTEPWLQEYVRMDLLQALKDAGFTRISVQSNSPRHRTVVAFKD